MNKERKIINFTQERINFDNNDAIETIVMSGLLNLSRDYEIISVNVSLTKDNKYLIVLILDLFD